MVTSIGRAASTPLGIAGHPLYPAFLPIPILCFIGALITDLAYLDTVSMMWLDFSTWLLLAGLIGGGIAGVLLIVDLFRAGRRRTGASTAHFILLLAAWITEVFNSFIHARDGWTAVMPTGLTLSMLAAVLGILAGWFWQSSHRRVDGAIR